MTLTVFFDVGGTLVESPDFYEVVARRLCGDKLDRKARHKCYYYGAMSELAFGKRSYYFGDINII